MPTATADIRQCLTTAYSDEELTISGRAGVKTETNAAIALEHREAVRLVPLEVEACDAPLLWRGYQSVSFCGTYEDGLRCPSRWLDPPRRGGRRGKAGVGYDNESAG